MNVYTREENPFVVANAGKPYVLRVRDMPHEQKPREKMLRFGAASLTMPELIAIVLGSGSKKEDVSSMASRMVEEYGIKSLAGKLDPKEMSEDLKIPLIKCLQIAACAEMGRRFFKKPEGESLVIRTAKDVFDYTVDMRNLSKEHLRGLYLNSHYKVIHDEVISIGTVDANIVHPREVFRPALEYAAAAIVLVHNHPSGNTIPSLEDREITKQIIEAGKIMGIEVLDHVIITKETFTSIMH
jgi:DNA repair protein RadC